MIEIRVPTTGNAGEDAVLVDWVVAVGDTVADGDVLATIETAKAVHEVTANGPGTLLARYAEAGDDVAEHALLAVIGAEGEAVPSGAQVGESAPAEAAGSSGASFEPLRTRDGSAAGSEGASFEGLRTRVPRQGASPRAAILAERNGIDVAALTGSGPGGRVIAPDVLAAKRAQPTEAQPSTAPAAGADDYELVRVTGARKVTAQRMHASLQESAQVTLTRYADAAVLLRHLARLREHQEQLGLPRIGVNELVLYATASALARHPEANAHFDWDGIRRYRSVHLGFAVDTPGALLVPVIRNASALSLTQLASAAAELVASARAGALTAAQMDGGTFTVSNLGSAGVHWFTPVLNPPQVGILGVGRALPASPSGADLMPLSLTFDHRALDGAAAAAVLADIAAAIETVDLLAV